MSELLPVLFLALMGLALLAYVVLDGYDLGVGMLIRRADAGERDRMLASIGPFWDANETWLVLGIGLLLVAFPKAHGMILGALYLPVLLMLVGLILRGVAFDFRIKAADADKALWDRAFLIGSWLASLAQGFMLGLYVTGFANDLAAQAFALMIAFALASGYRLLGAGWLLMKTDGALQQKAVGWASQALFGTAVGIAAVSLVTPLVSSHIRDKWFTLPAFIALLPIPLATAGLFVLARLFLRRLAADAASRNALGLERWSFAPFACAVAIFVLAFFGLAYSLYPYLVIDRLDLYAAAAAPESLAVMAIGAAITLPMILGYTMYCYRVFWGRV